MTKSKPVGGANDRPRDETIAQTGEGLPDDSSKPVEVDDEEAARFEQIIRGMGNPMSAGPEIPYDVEQAQGTGAENDDDQSPQQCLVEDVQREIDGPLKGSTSFFKADLQLLGKRGTAPQPSTPRRQPGCSDQERTMNSPTSTATQCVAAAATTWPCQMALANCSRLLV